MLLNQPKWIIEVFLSSTVAEEIAPFYFENTHYVYAFSEEVGTES